MGPLGVYSVQSLAQAGSPRAGCSGLCLDGFLSISKDGGFTISLGNLWHCLSHPHSKCFLMFRLHLLCSNLCPLPLVLSLANAVKNLAPCSL